MLGTAGRNGVAVAALALVFGLAAPGAAAEPPVATGPVLTAAENAVFAETALRAFAAAAIEVEGLRADYTPRIRVAASTQSRERAEALFAEMRARMHEAIRGNGLDPATYDAIAAAAQRDPDLRGRIDRFMESGGVVREATAPVSAPAPNGRPVASPSVAAHDDGAARRMARELEAARAMLVDLRGQLDAERARTQQARTDLAEVRADHAARLLDISRERARDLAALQRAEGERVALSREIGWHARRLQSVETAMAALAEEMATTPVADDPGGPPAQRPAAFRELEPIAAMRFESARRVAVMPALPADDGLRDELAALRARAAGAAARHGAERQAAAREMSRLASELASGVAALEGFAVSVALAPVAPEPIMPLAAMSLPAMPEQAMQDEGVPADAASPPPVAAETRAPEEAAPKEITQEDRVAVAGAATPPDDATPDEAVRQPDVAAAETAPLPVSAPPVADASSGDGVMDGIAAYVDGDYARAFAIWTPLAEGGNARAQFHLGALHFEGRGTPRDLDAAARWLARALEGGHAAAAGLLERIEGEKASGGVRKLAQGGPVPVPNPLR